MYPVNMDRSVDSDLLCPSQRFCAFKSVVTTSCYFREATSIHNSHGDLRSLSGDYRSWTLEEVTTAVIFSRRGHEERILDRQIATVYEDSNDPLRPSNIPGKRRLQ